MPESDTIHTTGTSIPPGAPVSYKRKDWFASASFGDAFQRSIYLLKKEFRWLVVVFFIGGLILSIILIPVNSVSATIFTLIANELFAPIPDYILLLELLIQSMIWGLVQNFILFFGTFILGTLALYHILKTIPSLRSLSPDSTITQFPLISTLEAAFLTATILTLSSILPFIVTIIQVLFFFLPLLLVLEHPSLVQSFKLSSGMRIQHWVRILGALILGYILILFAGTVGSTVYLNIEVIFNINGISMGFIGPILLSVLTQIPVAIVAPLVPLFSITLFAGARGAYQEKQHQKFMRQQQRYKLQPC